MGTPVEYLEAKYLLSNNKNGGDFGAFV